MTSLEVVNDLRALARVLRIDGPTHNTKRMVGKMLSTRADGAGELARWYTEANDNGAGTGTPLCGLLRLTLTLLAKVHRGQAPATAAGELEAIVIDLERLVSDRTADSKTDKKKKSSGRVPGNRAVSQLAKRIKRDRPTGAYDIDIARQFTESDEKKAQNLLRQLRRFPHLLD